MKKTSWLFRRLAFSLYQIPFRIIRLITVWYAPFYRVYPISIRFKAFLWLWFDTFFVFDLLEIINTLAQPHIRTLTDIEIGRGSKIFGKSLNLRLVVLDKHSVPVQRGFAYAFVTFNTINCYRAVPPDVLIHELTHVWQYQNFGAGYIPAALHAQKMPAGYNYAYTEGWYLSEHLFDFNAEQQADLIQDAYRLQNNQSVQWRRAIDKKGEIGRLAATILT